MIVQFNHNNKSLSFDLSKGTDISIPVQRYNGVSSFSIANAKYSDYQDGEFIGNVHKGAGCNLETIVFTPHGNGSHTECLGHIASETYYVNDCIDDAYMSCLVVSLDVVTNGDDNTLDFSHVDFDNLSHHTAIVIRSLPNSPAKESTDYSGKNAPFINADDMKSIVAAGIEHLLIDLPSVDKEWDNGALASHHVFWNYPENPRIHASITEFIDVPDSIRDGTYLLKLNIGNFISDAAPSKPELFAPIN